MKINKKFFSAREYLSFIFLLTATFIFVGNINIVNAQMGVAGSTCSMPGIQDTCGEGLVCGTDLKCKVPGVPDTAPPPDTSTKLPGANPAWCNNDPNLVYQNGICVPKNNPFGTTGLTGTSTLTDFILQVMKILLTFSGVIATLILIVGGFWYITSAGNEEQAEKGKKAIINAIIGLVVIILAYAIVTIISGTLLADNFK